MIRPKPHTRYRHMSSLDLDLDWQGSVFETEEVIGGVGKFWNRTYRFFQTSLMAVTIRKEDFWKWKQI